MSQIKPGDRVRVHQPGSLVFHHAKGTVLADDPENPVSRLGYEAWVHLDDFGDSELSATYAFAFDELRKIGDQR